MCQPKFFPAKSEPAESTEPASKKRKAPNSSNSRGKALTLEELQENFHLPINEVACKLGICVTVLKQQCREMGIVRWPYRKVRKLDNMLTALESAGPSKARPFALSNGEEERQRKIMTVKETLKELIADPNSCAHLKLGKVKNSSTAPADTATGGESLRASLEEEAGTKALTAGTAHVAKSKRNEDADVANGGKEQWSGDSPRSSISGCHGLKDPSAAARGSSGIYPPSLSLHQHQSLRSTDGGLTPLKHASMGSGADLPDDTKPEKGSLSLESLLRAALKRQLHGSPDESSVEQGAALGFHEDAGKVRGTFPSLAEGVRLAGLGLADDSKSAPGSVGKFMPALFPRHSETNARRSVLPSSSQSQQSGLSQGADENSSEAPRAELDLISRLGSQASQPGHRTGAGPAGPAHEGRHEGPVIQSGGPADQGRDGMGQGSARGSEVARESAADTRMPSISTCPHAAAVDPSEVPRVLPASQVGLASASLLALQRQQLALLEKQQLQQSQLAALLLNASAASQLARVHGAALNAASCTAATQGPRFITCFAPLSTPQMALAVNPTISQLNSPLGILALGSQGAIAQALQNQNALSVLQLYGQR